MQALVDKSWQLVSASEGKVIASREADGPALKMAASLGLAERRYGRWYATDVGSLAALSCSIHASDTFVPTAEFLQKAVLAALSIENKVVEARSAFIASQDDLLAAHRFVNLTCIAANGIPDVLEAINRLSAKGANAYFVRFLREKYRRAVKSLGKIDDRAEMLALAETLRDDLAHVQRELAASGKKASRKKLPRGKRDPFVEGAINLLDSRGIRVTADAVATEVGITPASVRTSKAWKKR